MYVNDFSMQQRQQLKLRQQPHERQMQRIERRIFFFYFHFHFMQRWNIKMQICILLLLLLDYSIVHIILVHILNRCATLSTGKYCCRCRSNRDIAKDEMQVCA